MGRCLLPDPVMKGWESSVLSTLVARRACHTLSGVSKAALVVAK